MRDDLKPLSKWKQHRNRALAAWRRSKDRRLRAAGTLKKAGRSALTLAISMLGAILVSYGVWSVNHPAGFVTAGLLLWAIQWNYGEGGKE